MVPQSVTEAVLLDRLITLGGRVLRPCETVGLTPDAAGVRLEVATGETIRARYVVGADGMHSTDTKAGSPSRGSEYRKSLLCTAGAVGVGSVRDPHERDQLCVLVDAVQDPVRFAAGTE
jgi:2-polyprenyl-6-methoxyphenol hydroxylase-like FAD-dependent oxidoreductase